MVSSEIEYGLRDDEDYKMPHPRALREFADWQENLQADHRDADGMVMMEGER